MNSAIIKLLKKHGSLRTCEIAGMIGLSPATIRNRVKGLKEQGLIAETAGSKHNPVEGHVLK